MAPSKNDVAAAETFVQKILKIVGDASTIPETGRAFGEFVRVQERSNTQAIISLVASLRTRGDAFYQRLRAEYETERRRALHSAEEEHYERFEPLYLAFVREKETQTKQKHPRCV